MDNRCQNNKYFGFLLFLNSMERNCFKNKNFTMFCSMLEKKYIAKFRNPLKSYL